MMRDELFPKRSPDKNQRLVMINGIYHVKYNVRNSLDKLERFQTLTWRISPIASFFQNQTNVF